MDIRNPITEHGYKGPLVFFKSVKHNFYGVSADTKESFEMGLGSEGEYVAVGMCEVDVTFTGDSREAEIAALEKAHKKLRAEFARRERFIEDRISKLRALPHTSAEVQP